MAALCLPGDGKVERVLAAEIGEGGHRALWYCIIAYLLADRIPGFSCPAPVTAQVEGRGDRSEI